jgi:hypothetical protein
MKIRPVGAELFHTDGRTNRQADMPKLIFAFRNTGNAPKNQSNKKLKIYSYFMFIRQKGNSIPR